MRIAFLKSALRASILPLAALAMLPSTASAQSAPAFEAALQASSDPGVKGFYKARQHRPLWFKNGNVVPAAARLVEIVRGADLDGMEGGPALAGRLEQAIEVAKSGRPEDLGTAELMLSSAWVEYVQTLRRPVNVGMVFTDGAVAPSAAFAPAILTSAAEARSLADHLDAVSELNPLYSRLRDGLAQWRQRGKPLPANASGLTSAAVEKRLLLNLDRARVLPTTDHSQRYVLVDAASEKLWLYEDGQVRDSMRVIVGKPGEQTPMVAGMIRTAVLNPYWNVPPDLVRKRVAAGVLKEGLPFLRTKNYQLLSDWSDNPSLIDPKSVDWAAVAAGRTELRVRQLPGATNAMGAMKFMFPNELGIYLHDTPDKMLFSEAERKLSSGCVRLEDAPRLAKWLFGKSPRTGSSDPEQVIALPNPVPVYITYLTAEWNGEQFAFNKDAYGRDGSGTRLAASQADFPGKANISSR